MAVVSSWASLPSCHREPERCKEQAGPDAEGAAAGAGVTAAGMGVRTAMTVRRRWGWNGTERQGRERLALGDQEQPTPTGTAQSPADGLTSTTAIGTGEREAMRRASLTSEAVPAPPGKATTNTET